MGFLKNLLYTAKIRNKRNFLLMKMYSHYKKDIWEYIRKKRYYRYKKVLYNQLRGKKKFNKRILYEVYSGVKFFVKRYNYKSNLLFIKKRLKLFYGNLLDTYIGRLGRVVARQKGDNIDKFFSILERRIDVLLYRALYALTIRFSRLFIYKRLIYINNKKIIKKVSEIIEIGDFIKVGNYPMNDFFFQYGYSNRLLVGTFKKKNLFYLFFCFFILYFFKYSFLFKLIEIKRGLKAKNQKFTEWWHMKQLLKEYKIHKWSILNGYWFFERKNTKAKRYVAEYKKQKLKEAKKIRKRLLDRKIKPFVFNFFFKIKLSKYTTKIKKIKKKKKKKKYVWKKYYLKLIKRSIKKYGIYKLYFFFLLKYIKKIINQKKLIYLRKKKTKPVTRIELIKFLRPYLRYFFNIIYKIKKLHYFLIVKYTKVRKIGKKINQNKVKNLIKKVILNKNIDKKNKIKIYEIYKKFLKKNKRLKNIILLKIKKKMKKMLKKLKFGFRLIKILNKKINEIIQMILKLNLSLIIPFTFTLKLKEYVDFFKKISNKAIKNHIKTIKKTKRLFKINKKLIRKIKYLKKNQKIFQLNKQILKLNNILIIGRRIEKEQKFLVNRKIAYQRINLIKQYYKLNNKIEGKYKQIKKLLLLKKLIKLRRKIKIKRLKKCFKILKQKKQKKYIKLKQIPIFIINRPIFYSKKINLILKKLKVILFFYSKKKKVKDMNKENSKYFYGITQLFVMRYRLKKFFKLIKPKIFKKYKIKMKNPNLSYMYTRYIKNKYFRQWFFSKKMLIYIKNGGFRPLIFLGYPSYLEINYKLHLILIYKKIKTEFVYYPFGIDKNSFYMYFKRKGYF